MVKKKGEMLANFKIWVLGVLGCVWGGGLVPPPSPSPLPLTPRAACLGAGLPLGTEGGGGRGREGQIDYGIAQDHASLHPFCVEALGVHMGSCRIVTRAHTFAHCQSIATVLQTALPQY